MKNAIKNRKKVKKGVSKNDNDDHAMENMQRK
jgi:hypothetical protein